MNNKALATIIFILTVFSSINIWIYFSAKKQPIIKAIISDDVTIQNLSMTRRTDNIYYGKYLDKKHFILDREVAIPNFRWIYNKQLSYALQRENREITLLINSCNRLSLLQKTLTSFMKYHDHDKYPIYEKIIIDDCRNKETAIELINNYYPEYEIVLTANNDYEYKYIPKGQKGPRITMAKDKIFKQVRTQWIFQLEEDWEFFKYDFIDYLFDIWEGSLHENNKTPYLFSTVLCWNEHNEQKPHFDKQYYYKNVSWFIHGLSYSFRAGLHPTFIYNIFGPWHGSYDTQYSGENYLCKIMQLNNLFIGMPGIEFCNHIGVGHSVKWQGRQRKP